MNEQMNRSRWSRPAKLISIGSKLLAVMLLGVLAAPVSAQYAGTASMSRDRVCKESGLKGSLFSLCVAYWEAQKCDLARHSRNRKACERLEQRFRAQSGGMELSTLFSKQVTQTVQPEGGIVTLADIVSIEFPEGAFTTPTQVVVRTSSDASVGLDFEEFAWIFRPASRLAYEIRVNTGVLPPLSEQVVATVFVSDEFASTVPDDYQIEVFVQIVSGGSQEVLDLFELMPSTFDPVQRTITAIIPSAAFTDSRTVDATYEAILTLASTPGVNRVSSQAVPRQDSSNLSSLFARIESRIFSVATRILDFIVAPANAQQSSNECEAVPIGCPVQGGCVVTSEFQPARAHPRTGVVRAHSGTDYRAATGTPILAAADGQVEQVYFSETYGNTVIIRHRDGAATLYAHLETTSVSRNSPVTKEQTIGTANSTGKEVKGSHLHFEYVPNGQIIRSKGRIDPDKCVNQQSTARGSITVSDNGRLADDAFAVYIDGVFVGETQIGQPNTIAINNIIPGPHTLRITCTVAPDNIGTLLVTLSDGVTFSDGSTSRSAILQLNESVEYSILVPSQNN